jgi:hypothetical protein
MFPAFDRSPSSALGIGFRALLLVAIALASGCHIIPNTDTASSRTGWAHSNLYNAPAPYPKLFVEIDAVEGYGPTKDELHALEEFLQRYCDKPGGITLKVDTIIPKRTARGRSAESLALEHLKGAPDPASALLYILFYDGRLRKNGKTENPSFTALPHPIVYIDRSYHLALNPYGKTFSRAMLLHETGHALGLCAESSQHGDEGHCLDSTCLMYSSLVFHGRRFFTFRNPWTNISLCKACAADLARNKTRTADGRFGFWGGYFVRHEEGYQVIGLPNWNYVHFGEPLRDVPDSIVADRQEAIVQITRGDYEACSTVADLNPWEHMPAFTRWTRDDRPGMQELAAGVFEKIVRQVEAMPDEEALPYLTDDFIAAAAPFPAIKERLVALREDLSAPAGYGGQLAREPRSAGSN